MSVSSQWYDGLIDFNVMSIWGSVESQNNDRGICVNDMILVVFVCRRVSSIPIYRS